MKKYSRFILTHSFDCLSAAIKGNNLPINLVTSISFRKNFPSVLLLLSSKLRYVCLQNSTTYYCVVFLRTYLHSNELISLDYLHSNELISFDYSLNVLFHTKLIFSFLIKVIPLKFNQNKNLELLTRELYSSEKSRFTYWRILIKIKILSKKLKNFNQDKTLKLLTREFYFDQNSRVTNSKRDVIIAS